VLTKNTKKKTNKKAAKKKTVKRKIKAIEPTLEISLEKINQELSILEQKKTTNIQKINHKKKITTQKVRIKILKIRFQKVVVEIEDFDIHDLNKIEVEIEHTSIEVVKDTGPIEISDDDKFIMFYNCMIKKVTDLEIKKYCADNNINFDLYEWVATIHPLKMMTKIAEYKKYLFYLDACRDTEAREKRNEELKEEIINSTELDDDGSQIVYLCDVTAGDDDYFECNVKLVDGELFYDDFDGRGWYQEDGFYEQETLDDELELLKKGISYENLNIVSDLRGEPEGSYMIHKIEVV